MVLFEKLKKYDIILASKSPRRQQLLNEAGIPFRVVATNINENDIEQGKPGETVLKLCSLKASACKDLVVNKNTILITADTVVSIEEQILNKPIDENDLRSMLGKLSGKVHSVYTGVCLSTLNDQRSFFEKTKVIFEELTNEEIDFYIENYKPYDKAGGYGIQEWIGLIGIKGIEGSYHNVVGLPVARLFKELKHIAR